MNARTALTALGSTLVLVWGCSGASGGVGTGDTGDGGSGHDASTSSSGGGSGGGSGSSSGGGSGSGSGSGGGSGSSSGGGSGSSSGSSSGGGSGSGSGGGGDAGFVCMSPAECSSSPSTPVCCAHIPVTGGSVPNCTTGPLTVACESSTACPTQLGTASCSGTEVVRLCAIPADCTETGAPKCCTFTQGTGTLNFCANGIVAGIAGAKCM